MSTVQLAHHMIESFKFAFSDKRALGDSYYVNMTTFVQLMNNKSHADMLRKRILDSI